jgi:uncharacterized protein (DUF2141 family)
MKKILLIASFIISSFLSLSAQEIETYNITVNISGLTSKKGKVLIALYKGKDEFLKKRFKGGMFKATNQKNAFVFKDIPKGEYAISFFHDENENDKMDTKIFGIPKESYGFSNNASGFMGPPSFEDAKFKLNKNTTITVKAN